MKIRVCHFLFILLLHSHFAAFGYGQSPPPDSERRVLAVVNGKTLTEQQVDESIGQEVYRVQQQLYLLRKQALNNLINRTVLEDEARARGTDVTSLTKRLLPAIVEIAESRLDHAYAEYRSVLGGMGELEARARVRLDVESFERIAGFKKAIGELRDRAHVETFLSEPLEPLVHVGRDGPALGVPDARVTLVVFADFQCPYCRQTAVWLKDLAHEHPKMLRIVFKHLPLSMHPDAFLAAQASDCAHRQGKFWEYHDRLFAEADLSHSALLKYAGAIGLDADRFQGCLDDESSRQAVQKDIQEARTLQIQGTPTLILNGRLLSGPRSKEDLKAAIDRALQK